MNRSRSHHEAVMAVARHLRRRRLDVTVGPRPSEILLVGRTDGGPLACAEASAGRPVCAADVAAGRFLVVRVRASSARHTRHRVCAGGRTYEYRYPQRFWNLHVHGVRLAEPDFWVLTSLPARAHTSFVVPAGVLRGKTVNLLVAAKARRSKLYRYQGRWQPLLAAA